MIRRTPHARTCTRRHGFSLMELAVVLGIIALIAGAGMTMASGALKAADRITTEERLNTIKLALDSFVKTYGYLPCPFNRTLLPTNALFGIENRVAGSIDCAAASAPGYVVTANIIIGGVPVRTLGLPDSYASDAWSNKLTYAVTALHTNGPHRIATNSGAIQMQYGPNATVYNVNMQRNSYTYASAAAGTIFSGVAATGLALNNVVHIRSSAASPVYNGSYSVTVLPSGTSFTLGALTFNALDAGPGAVEWQSAGTNTSYVVVSHGADGRGAFPTAAATIPTNRTCNDDPTANTSPPPCTSNATTTCIDIKNCDNNAIFVEAPYNDGTQATQYFDDYIVWGSNDLMRRPVNNRIYTSTVSACPTGVCETWCAACSKNFPHTTYGGDTVAPPSSFTTTADAVLCKKIVTSNATDCKASCVWSGTNANGYQACP